VLSVIIYSNFHILQLLHQMFNVCAVLLYDHLLNVLLQKPSCFQLLLLRYWHFTM